MADTCELLLCFSYSASSLTLSAFLNLLTKLKSSYLFSVWQVRELRVRGDLLKVTELEADVAGILFDLYDYITLILSPKA